VGPRAVLDTVVKRKIPSFRWESNPRTPIVQPVAQRYTDRAITALIIMRCFIIRIWCGAGIAQWYGAELRAGWWRVRIPAVSGNSSVHHRVQTGFVHTHPPIQWVPGALFPWVWSCQGVQLTTHLQLVLRSKNAFSYNSTPPIRLHGMVLS
jgi:hypothetical protein